MYDNPARTQEGDGTVSSPGVCSPKEKQEASLVGVGLTPSHGIVPRVQIHVVWLHMAHMSDNTPFPLGMFREGVR